MAEPPSFDVLTPERLTFAADGSPLVSVGLAEGETRYDLIPRGPLRVFSSAGDSVELPAGRRVRAVVRDGVPARLRWSVRVGVFRLREREAVREAVALWQGRGFAVRTLLVGAVFGLRGKVVDNRRVVVLLGATEEVDEAASLLERARAFGEGASLYREVIEAAKGSVALVDASGAERLVGPSLAFAVPDGAGITALQVEHDKGYRSHGREDRSYRGALYVTVDVEGKAALVNALPLEELLRSIVPSEIFASAPREALRAQAVAARGEVLAKIGVRHRGDPYMLCAEQHCQVSKGIAGEHPRTDEAIASTRGLLLFTAAGDLVDTVYSSTCGGHTENNEAAWGTQPDPYLRGKPDGAAVAELFAEGVDDENLERFLALDEPGICGSSSFARPDKMRWERRFSRQEIDRLLAPLGVGEVRNLRVGGRGVSGRATSLIVTGSRGAFEVEGELRIRRLLANLNSSLFVVEELPSGGGWRFRGAGWGHGVGMCQMGAISRAERGDAFDAILRHYYGPAELVSLY